MIVVLFLLETGTSVAEKDLTVAFIDAGEGEAVFLDLPSGEKILIDTGNVITGYHVAEFLKKRQVNSIDLLFITHPHLDHMGGIFHIVQTFDVHRIYDNGQPIKKLPANDVYRWYGELLADSTYGIAKKGDTFTFGDVVLEVLWPPSASSDNWNENSMVIMVRYGESSFLLTGDATHKVERHLLSEEERLKADVLKVGHHGASDASSVEFLKTVDPQYALISVDAENVRGYPDHATLSRLKATGAEIFFTYTHGDVLFRTKGKKIRIVDTRPDE